MKTRYSTVVGRRASRFHMAACLLILKAGIAVGATNAPGFRADFHSLDAWEPLTFPKIERHTRYALTNLAGRTVLKAEADASASGLVSTNGFDPYETPVLRWCWRVENVLPKGDAGSKAGDDYPLRVYVLFAYDPDLAPFAMRARYAIAKGLHGDYPPHASLNYIWANRQHGRRLLPSPYTDRSQMILLRMGTDRLGQWVEEEVNMLQDYRAAYGEDPPRAARLAIMSDADNTGGTAIGFVDWIVVTPEDGAE